MRHRDPGPILWGLRDALAGFLAHGAEDGTSLRGRRTLG